MFNFFNFQKPAEARVIQRANRLKLSPLKDIKVKIEGHAFKIFNISSSGLALFDSDDLIKTKTVRATIEYKDEGKSFNTMLEKVHHHDEDGFTGFKIIENGDEYEKFIINIFDIELQAAKFRKLRDESVKQSELGPSRWWEGGEGRDFYLVTNQDANKILYFYLSFLDNVISMDVDGKLFLGEVESDEMRFDRYQGSHTIVNPRPLTREAKDLLLKVVCNLPKIEQSVVDDLKRLVN